jgi:hypothetical protein
MHRMRVAGIPGFYANMQREVEKLAVEVSTQIPGHSWEGYCEDGQCNTTEVFLLCSACETRYPASPRRELDSDDLLPCATIARWRARFFAMWPRKQRNLATGKRYVNFHTDYCLAKLLVEKEWKDGWWVTAKQVAGRATITPGEEPLRIIRIGVELYNLGQLNDVAPKLLRHYNAEIMREVLE